MIIRQLKFSIMATFKSLKKPKIAAKLRLTRKSKSVSVNEDFGVRGNPMDSSSPFYFGFMAVAGGLIALTTLKALASASQVFVLIVISLFFAIGLNPAVNYFERRKMRRGYAVSIVVGSVLTFVGLFIWIAIPPLIDEINSFIDSAPQLVNDLKNNAFINDLNNKYGVIDSLESKVNSVIKDGAFVVTAFGGVVGVGRAFVSGVVATITILVLTLYFLSSLDKVVKIGLRFVPNSRRDRVAKLTNAIISRIGSFVGGQGIIAILAALFILIMGLAIGMPYTGPLSMLVLICGFIPLIGHFIGMTVVTLVSLTDSPQTAFIALALYIIYVQIENYVITPRIMRRSLSLPGLVTIIAALLGTSLLGLVGGLLAVPIAAAVLLILDEVVFPRADNS
jgi:predicted PurR-regulated permease PerM